jgi:ribonucleotide reductase alpha subunit
MGIPKSKSLSLGNHDSGNVQRDEREKCTSKRVVAREEAARGVLLSMVMGATTRFSELAATILAERYLRRGEDGQVVEDAGGMLARVAGAIAGPDCRECAA